MEPILLKSAPFFKTVPQGHGFGTHIFLSEACLYVRDLIIQIVVYDEIQDVVQTIVSQ